MEQTGVAITVKDKIGHSVTDASILNYTIDKTVPVVTASMTSNNNGSTPDTGNTAYARVGHIVTLAVTSSDTTAVVESGLDLTASQFGLVWKYQ